MIDIPYIVMIDIPYVDPMGYNAFLQTHICSELGNSHHGKGTPQCHVYPQEIASPNSQPN